MRSPTRSDIRTAGGTTPALDIERRPFVENVAATNTFEFRRQIAKIGKPVDRAEWRMTPPTVDATYSAALNEITFPAGILQPPFFDPQADDAVNYGAMGSVIGHEMTHGFDDHGRQYDATGNLRDWWTAEDGAGFQKRAALIIDQFDHYASRSTPCTSTASSRRTRTLPIWAGSKSRSRHWSSLSRGNRGR